MKYKGVNGEFFQVVDINKDNSDVLTESKMNELSLIWFTTDDNHLIIDTVDYSFNKNEIACFTSFHKVEVKNIHQIKLLKFNKPFYCILDHDSEVGCKGILYYGASNLPVLDVSPDDVENLEAIWKVLLMEMQSNDNLQLEMLQILLKRILIFCTRIYKKQLSYHALENNNIEIIREFNFLVETHFKEVHRVSDYAKMINKAPKTLSNLFNKLGNKTPLQFIQERLTLEAKRLLKYTDKSISEIAYELGFNDIQAFSRFFKKQLNLSALSFRNSG